MREAQSPALRARPIHTQDPDEAAALIRKVHPGCDWVRPIGHGEFRYAAQTIELGGVAISRQRSTSFFSNVTSVTKAVRGLWVLGGEASAKNGRLVTTMRRSDGFSVMPSEATGNFSQDYRGICLAVPIPRMQSLLRAMECDVDPLRFVDQSFSGPANHDNTAVGQALAAAFTQADQLATLPELPQVTNALGELLAYQFAWMIAVAVRPDARTGHPTALRRCQEYLHEHASNEVSLASMAEYANVSLRTAQELFAKELGCSITAYIREIRLDRVHRRLVTEQPSASISKIAYEEGFAHLGDFGRYYLHRFGERPSDTRRRH